MDILAEFERRMGALIRWHNEEIRQLQIMEAGSDRERRLESERTGLQNALTLLTRVKQEAAKAVKEVK